jgi:hypothetical protein
MIARRPACIGALALAALTALALAGCGKEGELQRPSPLIGHGTQADAQTRARQAAEADARQNAGKISDPQAPESADEVRNAGSVLPPPPPLNGSPIAGVASQPNEGPPPGGLPDPMHPATVPR